VAPGKQGVHPQPLDMVLHRVGKQRGKRRHDR
jgi:hypothetical protein